MQTDGNYQQTGGNALERAFLLGKTQEMHLRERETGEEKKQRRLDREKLSTDRRKCTWERVPIRKASRKSLQRSLL